MFTVESLGYKGLLSYLWGLGYQGFGGIGGSRVLGSPWHLVLLTN